LNGSPSGRCISRRRRVATGRQLEKYVQDRTVSSIASAAVPASYPSVTSAVMSVAFARCAYTIDPAGNYPDSLYQTSNEPFHSSKLMHRAGDGNGLGSVQLRHFVFMNDRFAPEAASLRPESNGWPPALDPQMKMLTLSSRTRILVTWVIRSSAKKISLERLWQS
jgi:hypothetical protein